jgi:hypothetical protein
MEMKSAFLGPRVWPEITKAVRRHPDKIFAAVAYFGSGASHLLPLTKGSRLVIDASDHAVRAGQTCPADLLKLMNAGVALFNMPNLHAKVIVCGKREAFVGSANISNRSAGYLLEAVLRSTDPAAVASAKEFVQDLCLNRITPAVLQRLRKIYQPPIVPSGGPRVPSTKTNLRPFIPRILLARIRLENWSEKDEALHKRAIIVAKKRRKHPRTYILDEFRRRGACPYRKDDIVIQVTEHAGGRDLVSPPGTVLHIQADTGKGRRNISMVCLELPNRRRRSTKTLARQLSRSAAKRLKRSGVIGNKVVAKEILRVLGQ